MSHCWPQTASSLNSEWHCALYPLRWCIYVVDLTCGVETKQQGTGNGEGQDPHSGNHHENSPPWAMGGVVQNGHHHCGVPADTSEFVLGMCVYRGYTVTFEWRGKYWYREIIRRKKRAYMKKMVLWNTKKWTANRMWIIKRPTKKQQMGNFYSETIRVFSNKPNGALI